MTTISLAANVVILLVLVGAWTRRRARRYLRRSHPELMSTLDRGARALAIMLVIYAFTLVLFTQ